MTPEDRALQILRIVGDSYVSGYGPSDDEDRAVLAIIRAAIAEEREACAKICDDEGHRRPIGEWLAAVACAKLIRAREAP